MAGVTWHEMGQKWMAYITINGHEVYLGLHDDKKLAQKAYDRLRRKHPDRRYKKNKNASTSYQKLS